MIIGRAIPVLFAATLAGSPAAAQGPNVVTYQCSDGTEFIAAFFRDDRTARIQLDGHALKLPQRLSASGARYAKGGVTLRIKGTGATLKRRGKTVTCVS